MNKLQNTTQTGGFPLKSDDIRYFLGLATIDAALYQALNSMLRGIGGDNFVVYGCAYSAPNCEAGWIMLDGELLKVDAHAITQTHFVKVSTDEDSRSFKDGSGPYNVHQKNRATVTVTTGNLLYAPSNNLLYQIAERLRSASTSNEGVIELATSAEALLGNSTMLGITPFLLNLFTGGVRCKVIEIGDWNMDSNDFRDITHGVVFDRIRSVEAIIRNDVDNYHYSINRHNVANNDMAGAVHHIDATEIRLSRLNTAAGGFFDSTDFDSTSYNRGWVTIWYSAT